MLTRCPTCTTIFRVNTEQLKARQGKVRCGACQGVFNALDSLVEEIVAGSLPLAAPASADPELVTEPEPESQLPSTFAVSPASTYGPELPKLPLTPGSEPGAGAEQGGLPAPAPAPEAEAGAGTDFEPALHEGAAHEGSARWSWLWASGISVAVVALLAQALMIFRVEIATVMPESRPWFIAACDMLHCRVELPRQVELLAIESSDLNPDPAFPGQPGRLRLQASIHNRASHAQEWPALELTLTDSNDRPVLRRALTARDYLLAARPAPGNLGAGIGGQQEIAVELALDTGKVLASGYRLYLFYP